MNMKSIQPIAIAALLCLGSTAAQAQFGASTCVPIAGTFPAPAPLSGSLTMAPLAKYGNYPAQVCTNIGVGAGFYVSFGGLHLLGRHHIQLARRARNVFNLLGR
jgi:hypothetical protein